MGDGPAVLPPHQRITRDRAATGPQQSAELEGPCRADLAATTAVLQLYPQLQTKFRHRSASGAVCHQGTLGGRIFICITSGYTGADELSAFIGPIVSRG